MKRFWLLLLFPWICFGTTHQIRDYHRIFLPVYKQNGQMMIAIRVFKRDNIPSYLIVNPESLTTQVDTIEHFSSRNPRKEGKASYTTAIDVQTTPYYRWLTYFTTAPNTHDALINQGLNHINHLSPHQVLTIDLCPTHNPFETIFFDTLAQVSKKNKHPTPIAISISGLWFIKHPHELQTLIDKEHRGLFEITWVNHSFSHPYYRGRQPIDNFLNDELVNINTEVLLTEQYLLEADETPSIFFRFPGLVSSQRLMHIIKKYGLIPLGTDAWLAKGETIHPGSIILVHGNGNEPQVVKTFLSSIDKLQLTSLHSALLQGEFHT